MYVLKGKILRGGGVGRTIGYPTANLDRRFFNGHPVPDGVWVCKIKVRSRKHAPYRKREFSGAGPKVESRDSWLRGVAVIGMKDEKRGGKKVEVHILDFKKNIYGWRLEAVLGKYLRKLEKFASVSSLVGQVRWDIANTRKVVLE